MLLGFIAHALAAPVADCGVTWGAANLAEVVDSADQSSRRMDRAGYLAARDTLLARLACVTEPLPGPIIGAVHRVVATAASLEHEDTRIAPALAGLLAADPGFQLPIALYPEGHPLRELLPHAAILARDGAGRTLASLPSGWLEVDGLARDTVPAARASVVQQLAGDGTVVETRYVWPGDPLGAWAASAALPAAPIAATHAGHRARAPLLAGTVVSMVATGVMFGVAWETRQDFDDLEISRSDPELRALQSRANGLTVGYAAAGLAALGLGVGLVVTW